MKGANVPDDLFDAKGRLVRKVKLSPFFLRPAYQYTSQEIRNEQRKDMFLSGTN